ncbi:uncharacterized protein H6S33_000553 [Morchella sextelata]|uniref:uncharacterized protein n=1 Tax=Morchella sextelata TaxID=1174677 RepID=UPI001D04CE04|nr:uncharacterized protein H6S33_000553 [Morchella sextelata]KAH0614917.1 hypothetical protein H6S33_000553 [Morchella sextelata]
MLPLRPLHRLLPRLPTRLLSTTTTTAPQHAQAQQGRPVPSKDDINTSSKENTRSSTNDEVAHASEAAYGRATNPFEEKQVADREEKTTKPGSPLEVSPANPQVSHQGEEDKSPTRGAKDAKRTSGGSRNAT